MARVLAVFISLLVSGVASGQATGDVLPQTMIGFFRPGMHVGVRSVDGTAKVNVSTYTDAQFALAKQVIDSESTRGSAGSLAEANAVARKALDAYISELDSSADKNAIRVMSLGRISLATVVGTGEDYILIELDGESKQKRIIPKASIGAIYLDANPLRFYVSGSPGGTSGGG